MRQVGRELGVRYVLEGGVRKAGNRVRITTQLLEAETGAHLWADRYDGELQDIFDFQDRITETIIGVIEPNVRRAEIERARRKRPESLGSGSAAQRSDHARLCDLQPQPNDLMLVLHRPLEPAYGNWTVVLGMRAKSPIFRQARMLAPTTENRTVGFYRAYLDRLIERNPPAPDVFDEAYWDRGRKRAAARRQSPLKTNDKRDAGGACVA